VSRHKLFPSQEYQATKDRRLARIRRRATPELTQAFEAGQISLRAYDILSRHGAQEQRAILAQQRREIESTRIAAETIEGILDHAKTTDVTVRLTEITAAICEALQRA
jgi:hypothetical protein